MKNQSIIKTIELAKPELDTIFGDGKWFNWFYYSYEAFK